MKTIIIAFVVCLALLAQVLANDRDYTIYLKSGDLLPPEGFYLDGIQEKHVMLQLYDIPTDDEKAALEAAGIQLLAYLPNYAWFAHVTKEGFRSLPAIDSVRWVAEIEPAYKAKREPVPKYAYDKEQVIRFVQFFPDVDLGDAKRAMETHDFHVYAEMPLAYGLVVAVPKERLDDLLALDAVQYTEIIYGPFKEMLDLSRQRISVNEVQAPPLSLTGSGVKVLVYDGGNAAPHPDYNGRVQVANFCGISPHTTGIAGIIGGTGSLSTPPGNLRGMATLATMVDHCWSAGLQAWNQTAQLEPHYRNAIQNFQVSVASNSWGVSIGPPNCALMGDYEAKAFLFDRIVRGDLGRRIQVNFAAGNANLGGCGTNPLPPGPLFMNYGTIATPAVAKNVISVGATWDVQNILEPYSSRGPIDDGRIKPEVVAPGGDINTTSFNNGYQELLSGTSFSTPHVAGSAALLVQLWKNKYGNQEPLPSTIKALFAQGAQDLRNPGPDYEVGFGQINVTASAELIARSDQTTKYARENQIAQSGEQTYFINIPDGSTMKLTLAWDDKEGTLNTNRNLINDVDLKLTSPAGSILLPYILDPRNPSNNAARGEDHTNNIEQAEWNNALGGYWKVTVRGTAIPYGPQTYSLASNLPLLLGATLSTSGAPRIGSTLTFDIAEQTNPGNTYVLAMSLSNTGIPLGDGRIIPLGIDLILLLSIQSPLAIGLANSIGTLPQNGITQATWSIPNVPDLVGLRVYAAFVTISPGAPSGIWSISNAVPIIVQA